MNRVFLALVLAATLTALGRDLFGAPLAGASPDAVAPALQHVTEGALKSASLAVEVALGLIGILALWMGVLRVAEAAGLVKSLARLLRPVLVRLFPDIPPDHPAMGAIVMNIAANMLGLGNAATPLGLEAMRHLQELNVRRRTASNAMCLFLAINTSGLTLIPTKAIALRAEHGSTNAVAILVPTLLATACSTVVAIVIAKLLAPRFDDDESDMPLPDPEPGES